MTKKEEMEEWEKKHLPEGIEEWPPSEEEKAKLYLCQCPACQNKFWMNLEKAAEDEGFRLVPADAITGAEQ